jgi:hypothetical protein
MRTPRPFRPLKQRVKDPSGRIDWLVAQLLGEVVKKRRDPLLSAAYQEFQPEIERALVRTLGPRNNTARMVRRAVRVIADSRRISQ